MHGAVLLCILYGSWMGMLAVHELGHVLHAWASGGTVARVVLPPLGFSRTDVNTTSPGFVAWGGPVWGTLLPLGALGVAQRSRLRSRPAFRRLALFFAGFCLIANGAYLAFGSFFDAGDTLDLLRDGTPRWTLIAFGCLTIPAGLYCWHRLGPRMGPSSQRVMSHKERVAK